VDKAVLEADEWINREEMEAELHSALESQRQALVNALQQRYLVTLEEGFGQLSRVLDGELTGRRDAPARDFVPADAARLRHQP
jgi:hypothetical protein